MRIKEKQNFLQNDSIKHHKYDEHFLLIDRQHQRQIDTEFELPFQQHCKPYQDEHNVNMFVTKI